jgi:hypothetical protein
MQVPQPEAFDRSSMILPDHFPSVQYQYQVGPDGNIVVPTALRHREKQPTTKCGRQENWKGGGREYQMGQGRY